MNNDLDDRLSARFDSGEDVDESQTDMSSSESRTDKSAQASQKAQNIKKEWNVRSFYLDDDLDGDLSTAFKRLDLQLSEAEVDVDFKKTRHFYPLIVKLGLERLEEMEVTEVTERFEGKDSI